MAASISTSPMTNLRKPVILCVDDEETPLLLRKFVLQKAGYQVLTAHSGKDALGIVRSRDVDLILSDYLMPNMTGAELAIQVKAHNPNLRVVLISGLNELPMDSTVADGFLSKVEGPDALCSRISTFLNGKQ
jgi:CheY-like chemotaxis protein